MSTPLLKRIDSQFAATIAATPAPAAELARRRRALDAVLAAGLPDMRDEGFRYAQLRALERLAYGAAAPPSQDDTTLANVAALLPQPLPEFTRLVFVDGRLCAPLSDGAAHLLAPGHSILVQGATLTHSLASPSAETDGEASAGPLAPAADRKAPPARRFALLNAAFAPESLHIELGADDKSGANGKPVKLEVIFVSRIAGTEAASYPQLRIHAGRRSILQLVERHLGPPDSACFCNALVELTLAADAQCTHYRQQSQGSAAVHLETLHATLGAAARYHLQALNVGAISARSTLAIELAGAGSHVVVHAAHVASATQVHDTQLTVEHVAPATVTEETFRGIASHRARIAFNGHMIVRPTARGADTRQSLRGLLTGPDSEADLRPQLEIYTDEVRATHGATVGKLDADMLFYLRSRGIDPETAQSLLKWAFLAEVIGHIDIAELRTHAQRLVSSRVQGLIGEALA